jgi:hypothetical protein
MGSQIRRWVVVGFILLLAFVAAFTLVTLLLPMGFTAPTGFQVAPGEITLRPGQGWQFRAIHEGKQIHGVVWTATSGRIGPEGFYTAPQTSGDYQVMASHPSTDFSASAIVHVVPEASEPTSALPLATLAESEPTAESTQANPAPTPTSRQPAVTPVQPTAKPTSTPTPAFASDLDPQDDLVDYTWLTPIEDTPPGSDISLACFDEDMRLVQAIPPELANQVSDWTFEDNLVFWIMLHEPISTTANTTISWLFAVDTDADPTTGRPLDAGVINPDIGPEITVGVRLDPPGKIFPYIYIWDVTTGDSELSETGLEARFTTERDAVLIRVPTASLTSQIEDLSQTEADWSKAVGRAAALVTSEQGAAIDFFPDLP